VSKQESKIKKEFKEKTSAIKFLDSNNKNLMNINQFQKMHSNEIIKHAL